MTRLMAYCPKCSSTDIIRDANATWNPYTEEWELAGVLDNIVCNTCGAEIDPVFRREAGEDEDPFFEEALSLLVKAGVLAEFPRPNKEDR